jgi:hypothetical protein
MTLPNPTRIEGESDEAFSAFRKYCAQGEKRSLRKLARRLHKSLTLLGVWSKRNRWRTRIVELETKQAIQENKMQGEARRQAAEQFAMRIEEQRLAFIEAEIAAAKKLMERAGEVLAQPFGDVKPDAAAKMFLAAHNIGSAVLNLPMLTVRRELQPSQRQVTNIVIRRDEQSDRVAKIYADFFSRPENRGHPQAERFVREYRELVAERAESGLRHCYR